MLIDLIIEHDAWDEAQLAPLAERAAMAALTHLGLDPTAHEIALLACDDARIATLNADFRGKPQPTNVLSWPDTDLSAESAGGTPHPPEDSFLGDIALAYETCAREATEQHKSFDDHLTHLIAHATLHLLGYDHIRDEDATLMEHHEVNILGKLGIANPYI